MEQTPLNCLEIGTTATVSDLTAEGILRQRMLDLGPIAGTPVSAVLSGPFGDPTAYEIRGAVIALRGEDAAQILVSPNP